ncbi:MAG: M23 family metallopeptidase [Candidatus Eisenbacteria bacterium]|nr:M23 family metallopeptidase [Candidatus Eisenbacteria bacterium]
MNRPLVLTGSFGEYRPGRFHAGLDYSTGEKVGEPVYAPLGGWIERVRSSGAGYGRSLYLRAPDGRLIVLGHLDAFDEPLASFVAAAQESSGQYEQDLWPPASRMNIRAGQRLGWSGQSGIGVPHLHLEVRRSDMAIHPGLAGAAIEDHVPPRIESVTLEPLDENSFVMRGRGPLTIVLGAKPETVLVEGRLRASVEAHDPGERRADLEPYEISLTWGSSWVACRMDSLSWATDMAEGDYVYDQGRAAAPGRHAVMLWTPAYFRARVMHAGVPDSLEAGTIEVSAGDPARALVLKARDLAGNACERTVWLRGPHARESGAGTTAIERGGDATPEARGFDFASLPHGRLRVSYRGAPEGMQRVKIGVSGGDTRLSVATLRAQEWSVVLPVPAGQSSAAFQLIGSQGTAGRAFDEAGPAFEIHRIGRGSGTTLTLGRAFSCVLPDSALFEESVVLIAKSVRSASASAELKPVSPVYDVGPASLPLQAPVRVRIASPDDPATGLYRNDPDGWDFVGRFAPADSMIFADSRCLGRFALFRDVLAPRLSPRRPPSHAARGAHSRWALECSVDERGSGVNARASYVVVDGIRRPTEWDAEQRVLRWRPLAPPARGEHRYTLVASDRAGNVRRSSGRFVLD